MEFGVKGVREFGFRAKTQDQLNPVAQTDGGGTVTHRFVYADKANVPAYMIKDSTRYRFVTDPRGSVRLVVKAETGAIAQRLDYSPFGRVTTDTNPGFQPFGFAGGLYDADTGLVRFGVRDYDSETGRWTAADPIRFAGGQANLYGYGVNDPINFVDPNGKFIFTAAAVVVSAKVAIGATASFAAAKLSGKSTDEALQGAATGAAFSLLPGGSARKVVGLATGLSGANAGARSFLKTGSLSCATKAGVYSGLQTAVATALGRRVGISNGVSVARSGAGGRAAVRRAGFAETAVGAFAGNVDR